MATLADLLVCLEGLDTPGAAPATSVRMSEALHRAVAIATELGMAASFTAATNEALADRVRAFARQQALAGHLACFPDDLPELAAVVRRRVSGTDHPAAGHDELMGAAATWYARRYPDWAVSGEVDQAVDRVLELVEVLVEVQLPAVTA